MRSKAFLATAVLLAATGFLTTATASHSLSGNYDVSTTPGVSVVWCPPETGMCIGGVQFSDAALAGHAPRQAIFSDASGGSVHFTVAQDFDGNNIAGEAGEPSVVACSTSSNLQADSEVPFSASFAVQTFVRVWHPDCPAAVATTGAITIQTA